MSKETNFNKQEEKQLKGVIKWKPFVKTSRRGDNYFNTRLIIEDNQEEIPLIFWEKDFASKNFNYGEKSDIEKIQELAENQNITVYGYYTLNNTFFKVARFEIGDLEDEIYV